jgi:hypothetical protein
MSACGASAQVQSATLKPFNTVQACLPFNVLIAPSPDAKSYDIVVDADQAVKDSLRAGVDASGTLSLVVSGSFSTNNSIKVTVRLPANQLLGVTTSSAVGADVVVSGAFRASGPFSVVNNGASSLSILGLSAPTVNINNPGAGQLLLKGSFGSVSLTNTGAGTAYISGVNTSVDLNVGGVGNVYVDAANDAVKITGQAGMASLATVTYNRGQCSLSSQFGSIFGSPCKQAAVTLPSGTIYWTCGLTLQGTFGCQGSSGSVSGGGSAATGVSSFNGPTTASASASGTGTQTSFSSSSTGGGGSSQSSTSNGNGVTSSTTTNGVTTVTVNGQTVTSQTVHCSSKAQNAVMVNI